VKILNTLVKSCVKADKSETINPVPAPSNTSGIIRMGRKTIFQEGVILKIRSIKILRKKTILILAQCWASCFTRSTSWGKFIREINAFPDFKVSAPAWHEPMKRDHKSVLTRRYAG
jgi:hypothetical protein